MLEFIFRSIYFLRKNTSFYKYDEFIHPGKVDEHDGLNLDENCVLKKLMHPIQGVPLNSFKTSTSQTN